MSEPRVRITIIEADGTEREPTEAERAEMAARPPCNCGQSAPEVEARVASLRVLPAHDSEPE